MNQYDAVDSGAAEGHYPAMNYHCRIRSFKLKTGAEVVLLKHRYQGEASAIKRAADHLLLDGVADAWAIVGFWAKTGNVNIDYRIYESSAMLKRAWPEVVRAAIQLDMDNKMRDR